MMNPGLTSNSMIWGRDEDSTTIRLEELLLQGSFVVAIAYGATALLCVQCTCMLLRCFNKPHLFRDSQLLAFVLLIFGLNTTYTILVIHTTQQAFVDNRNFPGGPFAYENSDSLSQVLLAADCCIIIITFLADALLVSGIIVILGSD